MEITHTFAIDLECAKVGCRDFEKCCHTQCANTVVINPVVVCVKSCSCGRVWTSHAAALFGLNKVEPSYLELKEDHCLNTRVAEIYILCCIVHI